ncbi:MAG: phycobiliprotein lyase [Prochlorococcus sp.]|nr:phycobiliprotein lyase [Prochlorococcus sp.]
MTDAPKPFPQPTDLGAFLELCAGEWMSLRSLFELSDGDDDWHTSERGEINVTLLSAGGDDLGGLDVQSQQGPSSQLKFFNDGVLRVTTADAEPRQGQWQFWSDGSVELNLPGPNQGQIQERISFTQANLRLRSTMSIDSTGMPQEGSFYSEIRRVARPAA